MKLTIEQRFTLYLMSNKVAGRVSLVVLFLPVLILWIAQAIGREFCELVVKYRVMWKTAGSPIYKAMADAIKQDNAPEVEVVEAE